jgi:NAD(P)-dependent dehydrogenase (short-subunit alcohol dehydrogenase family)
MAGLRFDFSGCRVLVTGGTSGIGFGVASAFADAGAQVSVTGRRASRSEYDKDLSRFDYRQAQMLDPSSLSGLIASIDQLDVLVNNAGESMMDRNEWDPPVFRDALQLHLGSAFQLATGLKPLLAKSKIEGGGSVLSCTSMSALRASLYVPGYGSAKAGLVMMTVNMGAAWARDNVRVNSVAPGLILTRMTARMQQPDMAEVEKSELAKIPMGRWGTPEDVAPTFLYLASPAARYITGQTVCVDGGYSVF